MGDKLQEVIDDLGRPGRLLAFCDETDLTTKPTSTMVGDLHLCGGIVLRSDTYASVADRLRAYLATVGQAEFHGTEIVNPKAASGWKSVGYVERVEALRYVCATVIATNAIFVYARVSKAQYADMMGAAGLTIPNYKTAVRQVCLRSVAAYLCKAPSAVLVIDREKSTPGPGLIKFDGGNALVGGGAISVNSKHVTGLQVADVIAYAVGRYLRRRDHIHASEGGDPFDGVIMEFLGNMRGRIRDALEPQPNSP